MTRIFLTYVLPLLLPSAIYITWVWYARRQHDHESDDPIPGLRRGPLFWNILAGLALMMAGLVAIALTSGVAPDSGEYQSPKLKDGKIVPPYFKKN